MTIWINLKFYQHSFSLNDLKRHKTWSILEIFQVYVTSPLTTPKQHCNIEEKYKKTFQNCWNDNLINFKFYNQSLDRTIWKVYYLIHFTNILSVCDRPYYYLETT